MPEARAVRTVLIERRGNLRRRGRRDRRGVVFRAVEQVQDPRGYLPAAYEGSTDSFSSRNPPSVGFWYEALSQNNEVLYAGSRRDPAGLVLEIPGPLRDNGTASLRTVLSPLRVSNFSLTIPDDPRITSLRFGSSRYSRLTMDGEHPLQRAPGDVGDGIVPVSLTDTPLLPRDGLNRELDDVREVIEGPALDEGPVRIMFAAEGFTAGNMNVFKAITKDAVDQIIDTCLLPGSVSSKVSFVRYNFASNEDSTSIQAKCAGGPASADTRFNSRLSPPGSPCCRLLNGFGLVKELHADRTGLVNIVIGVVNTERYGGSADGDECWFAGKNEFAVDLMLHEIGHQLGNLEDEYEESGVGGDKPGPNVTQDPQNPPWSGLATSSGAVYANPDPKRGCAAQATYLPASTAQPGTVGAFQGAYHDSCNWFRPTVDCKMRTVASGQPVNFCKVCCQVLHQSVTNLTS